jgi:hypothetical protein
VPLVNKVSKISPSIPTHDVLSVNSTTAIMADQQPAQSE